MFGWLDDILVKSPVVGSSCPCCEGQKERLKKMQRAILGENSEENEDFVCADCQQQNEAQYSEMSSSYHYRL